MELLSFLPSDSNNNNNNDNSSNTNRSSNKSVLRKYLNLVILVLILLIGSLNLLNIFTKKLDNCCIIHSPQFARTLRAKLGRMDFEKVLPLF